MLLVSYLTSFQIKHEFLVGSLFCSLFFCLEPSMKYYGQSLWRASSPRNLAIDVEARAHGAARSAMWHALVLPSIPNKLFSAMLCFH